MKIDLLVKKEVFRIENGDDGNLFVVRMPKMEYIGGIEISEEKLTAVIQDQHPVDAKYSTKEFKIALLQAVAANMSTEDAHDLADHG